MKLGHTARWLLQTMYSGGLNSFAAMEIPPEAQSTVRSKTTFVAQQPRSYHHHLEDAEQKAPSDLANADLVFF